MNRRFIAMQEMLSSRNGYNQWPAGTRFEPRNNKLYDHAGQARNFSMRDEFIRSVNPASGTPMIGADAFSLETVKRDTGYVLIADLDMLPRVKFDAKGKPVGLGKDTGPTLLEEYEEAERMIEVWAKHALRLRKKLGLTR